MIKVQVTFTNKDGLEETQQGRLICSVSEYGIPYRCFVHILLDDGRIVQNENSSSSKMVEQVESFIDELDYDETIKIIEEKGETK